MAQKAVMVLAGVLVGVVMSMSVPVLAHHNPEFKRLQARVTKLERAFSGGCSFAGATTWGSSLGNISGDPTLTCTDVPPTDIGVPSGCSGDAAVWTSSGLDC